MPNIWRWLLLALVVGAPVPAVAQQRVVIEGLANGEAWSTTGGSKLLARNGDRLAALGQLDLWGAAAISRHLLISALVEAEGGAASEESSGSLEIEQLEIQWTPKGSVTIEAGRLASIVGAFALRRLPDANPLIGTPESYPVSYPWGVKLAGAVGPIDYRIALVDQPASNDRYVPAGGSRLRPAVGVGITPTIGIRLGASVTSGPYLNSSVSATLPAGTRWSDFDQTVLVFDAGLSRGYFELHGEAAFSSYDVPGHSDAVPGQSAFLEVKYTWTPRLFTAVRVEHDRYAFVQPAAGGVWMGRATSFDNGEVGLGYRIGAHTLAKVSGRADFWRVAGPLRAILPNGRAVAFQVSRGFNLTDWFRRAR